MTNQNATADLPTTEVEQLKRQNALLLKRLLVVTGERDRLAQQLADQQKAGAA